MTIFYQQLSKDNVFIDLIIFDVIFLNKRLLLTAIFTTNVSNYLIHVARLHKLSKVWSVLKSALIFLLGEEIQFSPKRL